MTFDVASPVPLLEQELPTLNSLLKLKEDPTRDLKRHVDS